ncbi:transcription factor bHLH14-like [Momordica charantia]|uniref:Transcription factor n=1 Tax=Momordica charantia TaxID=3673 RepID=A0A6J1CSD3_MOMCH|nr:transcription factor bHLH14-like [Momordica charantia]
MNKGAGNDHAEAKRRREKLNHHFSSLRSLLPNASNSDNSEAAVLSDAVSYINELQVKMEDLESHLDVKKSNPEDEATSGAKKSVMEVEVEVKIIGLDRAVVRIQTKNMSYAVARLMEALRDLELKVHHATMCNSNDITLQDLVIGLPPQVETTEEDQNEELLKL